MVALPNVFNFQFSFLTLHGHSAGYDVALGVLVCESVFASRVEHKALFHCQNNSIVL